MKSLLIFAVVILTASAEERRAGVVLRGKENVQGHLIFTQTDKGVQITGQITGLEQGKHGFHVHAKGDLSNGCDSTGGHFNPHNVTHGAKEAQIRHVGDLGNIEANSAGVSDINILDNIISLGGEHCIIGRGLVVHSGEDDLGLGGQKDSLTTGHAGSRVACGVIGILTPEVWWDGQKSTGSLATCSIMTYMISATAAIILSILI